ncbi:YdcF family protein [Pollutibacter soli]|uniref:YdcF family protein n=1 Tax=Pollutibacter soli TaxID=3034157 RepID=UPI0030138CBB
MFRILIMLTGLTLINFIYGCVYPSRAQKNALKRAKERTYDVIVVPGVPLENGKWSRTMKGRIYWSKYLFDIGVARNVMFSGSAVYTPYREAEVMALYAEAIGIPKENIYTETRAEHSTENIYYSYYKAKELGFETVALASDPFQSKMLRDFAKNKISQDIGIIPMVMDTLNTIEPTMIDPVINFESLLVKDFVPITKRESIWKRLRGTRGKNIDYSVADAAK